MGGMGGWGGGMNRAKGLKNSGCHQQTDTSHPPRI
jgi:hypothetical protein